MSSNLQTVVVLVYAINFHFFTVRNEVAKVMFLHLSVCPQRGVCLSTCWDTAPPPREQHPRSRHPPRASTHLGADTSPGSRPPPGADTPQPPLWEQAPPGADTPPGDGYCCRRYASCWNAFLLL